MIKLNQLKSACTNFILASFLHRQENIAVSVVDMVTDEITAIHGLGFKQWVHLDASDEDGGKCS